MARKAAVIQAEVRDARSRLLADDLVQATLALEADVADEQAMRDRRLALETTLAQARQTEIEAEQTVRQGVPRLTSAQETWYSLAALRERVSTTMSIARERMRNADDDPGELRTGRDPEELDREADSVGAQERELSAEVAAKARALEEASAHRAGCEEAHRAEEARLAALVRAAADRREGLARLIGQVNSLRSRAEAAAAEIGRLTASSEQAAERAEQAARAFTALETKVAGLDAGELGLDTEHEQAVADLAALDEQLAELRREELAAAQDRAALAARVEALHVGLNRKDASSALLAATDQLDGLLGPVAVLVSVESGYERAVAAAFGAAADAVAVVGLDAAVGAFDHLKSEDLGRAGLLLGGTDPEPIGDWPTLPVGARYAIDVVEVPSELAGAVHRVLRKVAVVEDLPAAQSLVAALPDVVAVTRRRGRAEPALRGRRLLGAAQPDRGPGGHRRRRAATGRREPHLRAAALRPEPTRRATPQCHEPGRRGAGPVARVGRRDGGAGRGARPAEFDGPIGPGRVRSVTAGDPTGRTSAGPRRRRVGRPRAPAGVGR